MPASGERRGRRPAEGRATAGESTTTARRLGVADDVERRAVGYKAREVRLGLCGRPVGRIAEVERGGRVSRDHVVCDAGLESRHGDDLAELETPDDCTSRLELEEWPEPVHGALESAVGEPWSRGMPARPRERRAARRHCRGIRTGARDPSARARPRASCRESSAELCEERGERVVLGWELLSPEQEQTEVTRRRRRDRDPARARWRPRGHPSCRSRRGRGPRRRRCVRGGCPGQEPCRSGRRGRRVDGRDVAERRRNSASSPAYSGVQSDGDEPEQVLPNRLLVTALRRDVDELERPRGKAVGERGHRGSVPAA